MLYVGMDKETDHTLKLLLDLDGFAYATDGGYWLKYYVKKVRTTVERPHGIKYSLTLHLPSGKRIFGIDNAHRPEARRTPAGKSRRPLAVDHMHKGNRLVPYEFRDAETLLQDFATGVNAALKKSGVKI